MEIDFNNVEQLQRIVDTPEVKTIQLKMDGTANCIIITFELDLDHNTTINNQIGNTGCWEQAVFPLTGDLGPVITPTFRLECDGPILLKIEEERLKIDFFVPGRQISAYNRRAHEVTTLLKSQSFIIWYTGNLDFDVIGEAVRQNKKLFIIYHRNELRVKFDQFSNRLNENKIKNITNISNEFLFSLPDIEPIPFYVNFLDQYQLPNWPLIDNYLSAKIGHEEIGISEITIQISYQLCSSTWIENRVLLKDENVPENIEIANHLNTLQLVDYPEFDTWKNHHDHTSEIKTSIVKLSPTQREITFFADIEFDHSLTSVRYWMTIEHCDLALKTQKCHYILTGLINQQTSSSSHEIVGTICVDSTEHCHDNCGICFQVN